MANPNPNRNANQVFGISSMRAINLVNGNPDPSPSPSPSPDPNPNPKQALMLAARNGSLAAVEALVTAGANVNAATPHGTTTLMNAAP